MRRSIGRDMERSRPVHTKLILLVAVILPDTVGAALNDLSIDVVGRGPLQHLEIANEDALELSCVRGAIRFAKVVDNHVRVSQGLDGSLGDSVGCFEVCGIGCGSVQLDESAEDDSLVV